MDKTYPIFQYGISLCLLVSVDKGLFSRCKNWSIPPHFSSIFHPHIWVVGFFIFSIVPVDIFDSHLIGWTVFCPGGGRHRSRCGKNIDSVVSAHFSCLCMVFCSRAVLVHAVIVFVSTVGTHDIRHRLALTCQYGFPTSLFFFLSHVTPCYRFCSGRKSALGGALLNMGAPPRRQINSGHQGIQ